jgi:Zn-finger nucleic acid-binding protein
MDLTCPKCHGQMRTYERNGVHVDQCSDCRGIFLDRGELERLVDAENRWHAGAAPSAPGQPQQPAAGAAGGSQLGAVVGEVLQQARAAKHGRYGQQYGHGYQQRRRKKSFLDELFD